MTIDRRTRIGHVHLKVANLERAIAFYRDVLGFEVTQRGASDHGVSEAVYLRDPDGNGIELYRDLPREAWPRTDDGRLEMYSRPRDLAALLDTGETD
jgi:catechol 2,3-dioxygenase